MNKATLGVPSQPTKVTKRPSATNGLLTKWFAVHTPVTPESYEPLCSLIPIEVVDGVGTGGAHTAICTYDLVHPVNITSIGVAIASSPFVDMTVLGSDDLQYWEPVGQLQSNLVFYNGSLNRRLPAKFQATKKTPRYIKLTIYTAVLYSPSLYIIQLFVDDYRMGADVRPNGALFAIAVNLRKDEELPNTDLYRWDGGFLPMYERYLLPDLKAVDSSGSPLGLQGNVMYPFTTSGSGEDRNEAKAYLVPDKGDGSITAYEVGLLGVADPDAQSEAELIIFGGAYLWISDTPSKVYKLMSKVAAVTMSNTGIVIDSSGVYWDGVNEVLALSRYPVTVFRPAANYIKRTFNVTDVGAQVVFTSVPFKPQYMIMICVPNNASSTVSVCRCLPHIGWCNNDDTLLRQLWTTYDDAANTLTIIDTNDGLLMRLGTVYMFGWEWV